MKHLYLFAAAALCLAGSSLPASAQNASLVGTARDPQQSAMPNVAITLTNSQTGVSQATKTDTEGNYEFPVVRPGNYSLKAEQAGFKTFVQNSFSLSVDERARVDAVWSWAKPPRRSQSRRRRSACRPNRPPSATWSTTRRSSRSRSTAASSSIWPCCTAGTTVPSTNNRTFLAVPSGIGMSGINASGTREDSTNYLVDGINLSDMVQNQITFQPNIDMIQEFKVQTNSFNAEYGRNAGIVINAVSKPGTNGLHGTGYEFLRNQRFDAKNFFDPAGPIIPFNRDIYGYSIGGPIIKNRTFFFTSYEGREGHEVASLKTLVPSAAQRATVTNPMVQKLLALVPAANDSTGTFLRRPHAAQPHAEPVHRPHRPQLLGEGLHLRQLHYQPRQRTEPTLQGNNLPGFGDFRPAKRALLALGYTHVFSPSRDQRVARRAKPRAHRFHPSVTSTARPLSASLRRPPFSPTSTSPVSLIFGGISGFPQGRGDTTYQYGDTLCWVNGKQSIRFGAEFRRFDNNNFNGGTGGVINFATVAAIPRGHTQLGHRDRAAGQPRAPRQRPQRSLCRTISKSAQL